MLQNIDFFVHCIEKRRKDLRCGKTFPVKLAGRNAGDAPSECDPYSDFFCCSEQNWCGGSYRHCKCRECVDYRCAQTAENISQPPRRDLWSFSRQFKKNTSR